MRSTRQRQVKPPENCSDECQAGGGHVLLPADDPLNGDLIHGDTVQEVLLATFARDREIRTKAAKPGTTEVERSPVDGPHPGAVDDSE